MVKNARFFRQRQVLFILGLGLGGLLVIGGILFFLSGGNPPPGSAGAFASSGIAVAHRQADPASCAPCHRPEFESWRSSHHAQAESALSAGDPPLPAAFSAAIRWIGVAPLKQLLVPADAGRIQVSDQAFDPAARAWFPVFGSDTRLPGEWGHWTGRGMNWNSQCAFCHNTDVAKNYRAETDSYATTVGHRGLTCAACHGAASAPLTRIQAEETCAACHARRGELGGDYHPGGAFADHFSLLIVDETDAYYPDGQVKDEDFEYAAFLGSKMHAAGVTCLDCHDPHSGHLRAVGNNLCLTCHNGGNPKAPVIQPELHSHHGAGSAGDLCVNCHMPTTVYMQRHARRDHGFTLPDPLLTEKIGEPNACNRCHGDQKAAWALAAVEKWYGPKMERPTRQRALAIAAARTRSPEAPAQLLGILHSDPIGYWRAVAAGLLAGGWDEPGVQAALVSGLHDPDPLVRAFAARSLGPSGGTASATANDAGAAERQAALTATLEDSSRSVRIESAWALRDQVELTGRAGSELTAFLDFNRDQPIGAYRQGMFDLSRKNLPAAVGEFERAVKWDPLSTPLRSALAVGYSLEDRPADAAEQLREACRRAPQDAELRFQLGLALNEAGDQAGAAAALEEATTLDPAHAEAWYNLGLARMQEKRWPEAIAALRHAEAVQPGSARVAYGLAVAFYQSGDRAQALVYGQEALKRDPTMAAAQQLLDALGSGAPR